MAMDRGGAECLLDLKRRFTMAPIFWHFDPAIPTVMETDASDFAIGAVLSQQVEGRLHPVAFHSRKMDKAKINYDIHDKEMLAVVSAFKEWRRYLEGARFQIIVYTDHKNLEYFNSYDKGGKPASSSMGTRTYRL